MKKCTIFDIIGVGIVASVCTYMLVKHIHKDIFEDSSEGHTDENVLDFSLIESNINNVDSINEIRVQAFSNIYNRHREAAEVIRDTVENMNGNTEVISEHKEEFDNMLYDLNMLSEEE